MLPYEIGHLQNTALGAWIETKSSIRIQNSLHQRNAWVVQSTLYDVIAFYLSCVIYCFFTTHYQFITQLSYKLAECYNQ